MLVLVSFVGWVVAALRGDLHATARTARALYRLACATLAAVMLLVTAGELWLFVLAWSPRAFFSHASVAVHRGGIAAQRAARKKW